MAESLPNGEARSEEKVRERVHAVILEVAPNPSGFSGPESRLLEDLDFHSLALLELAFTLEDEFDLQPIDEERAREIQTVGDVEMHVIAELAQKVTELS